MITNFVYFTDPHLRGNNPLSRKDNFVETAFKKIAWVVDCANDADAAIICGGDWVQRPDTAPNVIAQLQQVLSRAQNPVFTILGNHDIYGYNPGTFFRTPLHIIEVAGTIRRLSAEPTIWREVQLTGVDAHYDLDQNGRTIDYTEVRDSGLAKIHVVHGFLTDHEWPHVPCTTLEAVKNTMADLVLTGHEHSGFGVHRAGGKTFCNPGALLRVSASVGDVNQVVKVALITVDSKTNEIDIKLVPLPQDIARPAEEVLDRERLLEEKRIEQVMANFTDNLGTFSFDPSKSAFQLLQDYAQQESLSPKIVDEANRRLQEADIELAKIRAKEKENI